MVHELDQQCASSCAFSIKSFDQIKLEPTISPHGGDNMFARFEAGVNTFPHISQIEYFLSIIYIFWMESRKMFHYTAKRSYKQGILSKNIQRDTWNNPAVLYPLPHSKWGKVKKQKPSGKVLEMLPHLKKGAANVWKKRADISQNVGKQMSGPDGTCTNTEMTNEFLGIQEFGESTHSDPYACWAQCTNNHSIHSDPSIKSDMGQNLQCFSPHICLRTDLHE